MQAKDLQAKIETLDTKQQEVINKLFQYISQPDRTGKSIRDSILNEVRERVEESNNAVE